MAVRTRRPKLFAQIDRVANQQADTVGQADVVAVRASVREWALADPDNLAEAVDLDHAINTAVEQYFEARKPRVRDHQLSFFQDDAWLPIAEGLVVRMGDVNGFQFDAWWQIQTKEFLTAGAAYQTKGDYYQSRRPLLPNTDGHLRNVEREHFGWQSSDANHDDDD